jgi:hypothetical protein
MLAKAKGEAKEAKEANVKIKIKIRIKTLAGQRQERQKKKSKICSYITRSSVPTFACDYSSCSPPLGAANYNYNTEEKGDPCLGVGL